MTSIASSWTHANPSRGAWINQTTFTMGDSGMNVLRTLVVGIDCRELEPLEQMPNFKKNRLSSIFVIWGHPIAIFDRSCTFVKVSTPPAMPSPHRRWQDRRAHLQLFNFRVLLARKSVTWFIQVNIYSSRVLSQASGWERHSSHPLAVYSGAQRLSAWAASLSARNRPMSDEEGARVPHDEPHPGQVLANPHSPPHLSRSFLFAASSSLAIATIEASSVWTRSRDQR
jgi:hypothetical protein